jgi:methylglutaconyl-CoA hydratase
MDAHFTTLDVHHAGHVATVTLNRPQVRNAFDAQAIAELAGAFAGLAALPDLRVVVLAGAGDVFCAGADLAYMRQVATLGEAENKADALALADMLRAVYTCPVPVIARIQGDCYGGGIGLAAACDIAVAVSGARFALSEVKLGLIPSVISPYVLRAIGERAARRYFVSAERFDAAEALRLGLLHEVAESETLDQRVGALVQAIAANGPQAVRGAKRLALDLAGVALSDALLHETAGRIARQRATPEGREGMAAFLEKRQPAWLAPHHQPPA